MKEIDKVLIEIKIHNILRKVVGRKLANKIMGWGTLEELLEELKDSNN